MASGGPLVGDHLYWNRALVLSIFELTLALIFIFLTVMICTLVLRLAKQRMPMLSAVRVCLCLLTSLWMGGLLGVTAAPWRALRPIIRLSHAQLGDACWIQL